jgi:Putative auto-transporter adhesin, head GIN domain
MVCTALAAMTVWAANAQKTIINDPHAEVRNVKGFHGIEVSSAIQLFLSQGAEESVAVSASDPKYVARIRTEVDNGVLKIWYDNQKWNWSSANRKLKAYVSFKTLDKLYASGACDLLIQGVISGPSLDLRLSGASDFKGSVKLNQLALNQSGASDVSINGMVNVLTIRATGASDVKGFDLISDTCTAQASGASDISISVNKELNAHASGASSINYKGDAVIRQMESSGASSVSKKS